MTNEIIQVLGFAGSLRQKSHNRALLRAAESLMPAGMELEIIDLIDLPLFNQDVEAQGIPASIMAFREAMNAADHLVSEALYLTDPDGHGIEIYRDRPRDTWEYLNGTLKMGTDPFDVHGVLGELNGHFDKLSVSRSASEWSALDAKTVMGRMHLHVSHLVSSLDFYTDVVGFDLVLRYGPTAGFVSAGGYHHHLGMNTWAGAGAPPPPDDTARLLWYEIVVADETAVTELEKRLENAGVVGVRNGRSLQFQDPSANLIHITPALS
ncbi:MAG: hypothetical protein GWP17_00975 [Aquificales bacterium]|nr:hypothetical protein [Aquificales bacterium]